MGYVIAMIMFMSSAMSVWFFNQNQTMMEESRRHADTDASINHIKIYADAIENFIKNNPSYHGKVNDGQLTLPEWFAGDPCIKKQIFSGKGYIGIPAMPGLLEALHQTLQGSLLLGRVKKGEIIHFTEGKLEVPVPPEMLNGFIVYVI